MDQINRFEITLQQIIGAVERLSNTKTQFSQLDLLNEIEELRDRLSREPFSANPMYGFLYRDGKKERLITRPSLNDRILQETILPEMNRIAESVIPDSVYGFRPGRSTFKAALSISQGLSAGNTFVLLADISNFFPSVKNEILMRILADLFPLKLKEILMALISAPIILEKGERLEITGLPLGQPVSPLLSNLYLLDIDRVFQQQKDSIYLRYGDDIVTLSKTFEGSVSSEFLLVSELAKLGLSINESKTRHFRFEGAPFIYLGHTVDEKGVYERLSERRITKILSKEVQSFQPPELSDIDMIPPTRTQTLYITEHSIYLSIRQGLIIVKQGREILREVPLRQVDRIFILSGISMSSGFVSCCIQRNIPVLFFVDRGKAYGTLVSGSMPNPLRLRAQYDLLANRERRITIARSIIHAKTKAMLFRLSRIPETHQIKSSLKTVFDQVLKATRIDELLGIEGNATHLYYQGFTKQIYVPEFEFKVRSKRPPKDPINSIMSFTYSLLFAEMQSALLMFGLDPHVGMLHELRKSHLALASDLIEPYRHLIGDAFVLTLVNKKQIKADGFFSAAHGAVYMKPETRKLVIIAYEDYLRQNLKKQEGQMTHTRRHLIHLAAHSMLRLILGEIGELNLPLKDIPEEDTIDNQ